tara:strand:- start:1986 stop:2522 length:537 start_codon:yes stop_codon:yes gene_type:complete
VEKMSEFKVGDKVVRIKAGTGDLAVGTVCEINQVSKSGCVVGVAGHGGMYSAGCFELHNEIKTVTHEGKVYQIGGVYEFSDEGIEWRLDLLTSIDDLEDLPFKGKSFGWELIRESKSKIGTITPAPIKLVDSAAYTYMFGGFDMIGIYKKSVDRFIRNDGFTSASCCTNIRLMTVGSE